jgi:hypothetical protein
VDDWRRVHSASPAECTTNAQPYDPAVPLKRFTATPCEDHSDRAVLVPFDPSKAYDAKPRRIGHSWHVNATRIAFGLPESQAAGISAEDLACPPHL